jgi:probable HAF family extracellular repeat protein
MSATAYAVNDDGDASGDAYLPSGTHAVLWEESGVTVLDASSMGSLSYGVNGAEWAVGALPIPYPTHAFLYRNGQMEDIHPALGQPAQPESLARGINDAGLIVGLAGPVAQKRPFLYNSQTGEVDFVDPLPGHAMAFGFAVNAAGHAVGLSLNADWKDDHVFLYADGQVIDRGPATWAWGINASDTIVGSKAFPGATTSTAYRLPANADFENLGHTTVAGYKGSNGMGINDQGVVAGHSFGTGGGAPFRAFVQFPEGSPEPGWYDLQDITTNAGSWTLESAKDINNSGQIVGYGTVDGETRAFLLTPKSGFVVPLKPIDDYAIAFLMLFGGVEVGGAGWGVLPGGKPVPIDPEWWKRLSTSEKDLMLGFAVRKVSALLDDGRSREIIERAGIEVVQQAIERLERGT